MTIPEDKSLPLRLASLRNLLPKKPTSLGGGSKQKEVNETEKMKQESKDGQEHNESRVGGEVREGLLAAEASDKMKKVLETSEETQRLEKMKIAYGQQQQHEGASTVRNLFWSVVVCLYIFYVLKQRFFGTYSVQED